VCSSYSTETNAFTPEEVRLLEELAGDLAFGINVLRVRAHRKLAEEKVVRLAAIVESNLPVDRQTVRSGRVFEYTITGKDRQGRSLPDEVSTGLLSGGRLSKAVRLVGGLVALRKGTKPRTKLKRQVICNTLKILHLNIVACLN
jgi:hypothetical protein